MSRVVWCRLSLVGILGFFANVNSMAEPPQSVLQHAIDQLDPSLQVAAWFATTEGEVLAEHQSTHPLASASAIKTALLVELFARYEHELDRVPEQPMLRILQDDHPAIRHFNANQRKEIQQGLQGKTVRQIGHMMMGSEPASNLVYNAAANASIALLDGPEKATEAIHQRSEALQGIIVRRYMLARRDQPGDNTITAHSLGGLWQMLLGAKLPGISPTTREAILGGILQSENRFGLPGIHRFKGGSLDSLPIVRVESGSWQSAEKEPAKIYVFIIQRSKLHENISAADAGEELAKHAKVIVRTVLANE